MWSLPPAGRADIREFESLATVAIRVPQAVFCLLTEKVRVYGAAKTVVDCFKHRNKIGLDVALEALKDAWRMRKAPAGDLWRCAQVAASPT